MSAKIKLQTFRCGNPPKRGEGFRIGVVRRPPRGVPKTRWDEHFDVWLPVLAPSEALLRTGLHDKDINAFFKRYEKELAESGEKRTTVDFLAKLAARLPISIGCYCEDESTCHRSALHRIILRAANDSKTKDA